MSSFGGHLVVFSYALWLRGVGWENPSAFFLIWYKCFTVQASCKNDLFLMFNTSKSPFSQLLGILAGFGKHLKFGR